MTVDGRVRLLAARIAADVADLRSNPREPWPTARLATDVTTSGTGVTDTALAFTPVAGKTYAVEGRVLVTTTSALTGVRLTLAWPTGVTGSASISVPVGLGAHAEQHSATSGLLIATGSGSLTAVVATIEAVLVAGTTVGSGAVRVQLASGLLGTTVAIRAGSLLRCRAY